MRKPFTLEVDELAWQLAGSLLEDFEPFLPSTLHIAVKEAISLRNVKMYREICAGTEYINSDLSPAQFKAVRQILDLFKNFAFAQDVMTPQEVLDNSISKFLENQKRLETFSCVEDDVVKDILFRARGHIDQILGEFSKFDILERAAFGKKSSVGIPMRNACEGARLEAPITGSSDQILWFQHLYGCWNRPAFNYAVERAANRKVPLFREIDTLEAVLVDKTFKSKRMIIPNTTIGTLYTSGLGRTIQDCLKAAGYDIQTLQKTHGCLAKIGSITGTLVTGDQSLASDNITSWLIARLFSKPWAFALELGRIGRIKLYDHTIESKTFAGMGVGFTFPLQTLVFLGILLAIRDHLGLDDQTVVSVYGDDLIYDERMHDTVMSTFPKLGLIMNADKTFASGYFRESCGQDYYRGIDVRPYHFGKASVRALSGAFLEATLYKEINGLLRRFSPYELTATLRLLMGLVKQLRGNKTLLVVPPDYPDTAGVKTESLDFPGIDFETCFRRDCHGTIRFSYLGFTPKWRKENRHEPYLWLALRQPGTMDLDASFKKIKTAYRHHGDFSTGRPIFRWEKPRDHPKSLKEEKRCATPRSKVSGRRLVPLESFIPQQDAGNYREQTGVTSHWTPK